MSRHDVQEPRRGTFPDARDSLNEMVYPWPNGLALALLTAGIAVHYDEGGKIK